MPKPVKEIKIIPQVRYLCPNCDTILEEGERRCSDCNRFGSRVEGIPCPHCDEFIRTEELP